MSNSGNSNKHDKYHSDSLYVDDPIDFVELLFLVWKRKYFILACTLIPLVGSFTYSFYQPNVYKSVTQITMAEYSGYIDLTDRLNLIMCPAQEEICYEPETLDLRVLWQDLFNSNFRSTVFLNSFFNSQEVMKALTLDLYPIVPDKHILFTLLEQSILSNGTITLMSTEPAIASILLNNYSIFTGSVTNKQLYDIVNISLEKYTNVSQTITYSKIRFYKKLMHDIKFFEDQIAIFKNNITITSNSGIKKSKDMYPDYLWGFLQLKDRLAVERNREFVVPKSLLESKTINEKLNYAFVGKREFIVTDELLERLSKQIISIQSMKDETSLDPLSFNHDESSLNNTIAIQKSYKIIPVITLAGLFLGIMITMFFNFAQLIIKSHKENKYDN
jgi:hypothetical protein